MSETKKSSKKKFIAIIPIVAILISLVILVPEINQEDTSSERSNLSQETQQVQQEISKKAVILDQLDSELPNYFFQKRAQEYLEEAGYTVDLFTTDDITVEFYKNLPAMDYKYIVMRTHGAGGGFTESAFLFTGEKYSKTKYIQEQLNGQVLPGVPIIDEDYEIVSFDEIDNIEEELYFTVGSKMVKELMIGDFPDSVILIGGCDALADSDLALSLIARGASDVIGWNGLIDSDDNDRVVLAFLRETLENKLEINDAIQTVTLEYGPFKRSTDLKYYYSG